MRSGKPDKPAKQSRRRNGSHKKLLAAPGKSGLCNPRFEGLFFPFSVLSELFDGFGDLLSAVSSVGLAVGAPLWPRRLQGGLAFFGFEVAREMGIDEDMNDASGRDRRKGRDDPKI